MTRVTLWLSIGLSGLLYELVRALFGLEFRVEALYTGLYWSGVALALHWKYGPREASS